MSNERKQENKDNKRQDSFRKDSRDEKAQETKPELKVISSPMPQGGRDKTEEEKEERDEKLSSSSQSV